MRGDEGRPASFRDSARIEILGLKLAVQQFQPAVEGLMLASKQRASFRAHFLTVHSVVEAQDNATLRDALTRADLLFMDGVPLVWAAKVRGFHRAERVCGPDMMLALCDQGRSAGLRHYFVGGAPGTPDALADRLSARFPGLKVVGVVSPPFSESTPAENDALITSINAVDPDVVWIGLGTPKQDLWAARHQRSLSVGTILTVGAAFDFHSGRLRRAPTWMQSRGLEWLFRLATEPRRLASRYLVTNTRFVFMTAVQLVRDRLARLSRPK